MSFINQSETKHNMPIRPALAADAAQCIALRAVTRDNSISVQDLESMGITVESWGQATADGTILGFVAEAEGSLQAYCFGDTGSGEILVLVVAAEADGRGLGRTLLARVVEQLRQQGHQRLFLGCSTDSSVRSHGFYRHLGWIPTGRLDDNGDEILEWHSGAEMEESPNAAFTRIADQLGYNFDGKIKIGGNYVPFIVNGKEIYVSGQIPRVDDVIVVTGRAGSDVALAQAQLAAKVCAMRALALLRQAVGDLGRVKKVLRISVYIQCSDDFTLHSEVADGASEVLYAVLGSAGVHTRTSVGVYQLPKNATVELDLLACFE